MSNSRTTQHTVQRSLYMIMTAMIEFRLSMSGDSCNIEASCLVTENIQARLCLCANDVLGSGTNQKEEPWMPTFRNMWHVTLHVPSFFFNSE